MNERRVGKFIIVKRNKTVIVSMQGAATQNICFHNYHTKKRADFEQFSNEIMNIKKVDYNEIYRLSRENNMRAFGYSGRIIF